MLKLLLCVISKHVEIFLGMHNCRGWPSVVQKVTWQMQSYVLPFLKPWWWISEVPFLTHNLKLLFLPVWLNDKFHKNNCQLLRSPGQKHPKLKHCRTAMYFNGNKEINEQKTTWSKATKAKWFQNKYSITNVYMYIIYVYIIIYI